MVLNGTYVREITYKYDYVLKSILSALVFVIHTFVRTYEFDCMYVNNQLFVCDIREITFAENYHKSLFAFNDEW